MHHPVSFLYHPVNKLLIALFGESSHRWQELMGLHEGGYWLPDHVVMAGLVVVIVGAVLIPTSRKLSIENPGKVQQVFEVLITGLIDLIEDVVLWQRSGLRVEGEYQPPGEARGRELALERLVNDIVDGAQSQW